MASDVMSVTLNKDCMAVLEIPASQERIGLTGTDHKVESLGRAARRARLQGGE